MHTSDARRKSSFYNAPCPLLLTWGYVRNICFWPPCGTNLVMAVSYLEDGPDGYGLAVAQQST